MTEEERPVYLAIREADERFQRDGAGGTKTWMREYFLPALASHGLKIVPIVPSDDEHGDGE